MEEVSLEENSRGERERASLSKRTGSEIRPCCFRIGPKSLLFQLTTRSARVARNNMSGRGFSGLFRRPLGLPDRPPTPPLVKSRPKESSISLYLPPRSQDTIAFHVFSVKLFSFIRPLSRVQESSCRDLGNSIPTPPPPPPRRNRLVHGIRTNAQRFFFLKRRFTSSILSSSKSSSSRGIYRKKIHPSPIYRKLEEERKLALVGKLIRGFHSVPRCSPVTEMPEMFSMNTECAPVNSIFPAAGSNGVLHRTSPRFSLPLINRCSLHSRNAENERCWGGGITKRGFLSSPPLFLPPLFSPSSFSFFRFALEIVLSKTIDNNVGAC